MTLETAKSVVSREVQLARESNNKDGIRFDLFGGEPLLQFNLIKELCAWIWETITDVKIDIFITTNGTLLDDEKKEWFKAHKEKSILSCLLMGEMTCKKVIEGVILQICL